MSDDSVEFDNGARISIQDPIEDHPRPFGEEAYRCLYSRPGESNFIDGVARKFPERTPPGVDQEHRALERLSDLAVAAAGDGDDDRLAVVVPPDVAVPDLLHNASLGGRLYRITATVGSNRIEELPVSLTRPDSLLEFSARLANGIAAFHDRSVTLGRVGPDTVVWSKHTATEPDRLSELAALTGSPVGQIWVTDFATAIVHESDSAPTERHLDAQQVAQLTIDLIGAGDLGPVPRPIIALLQEVSANPTFTSGQLHPADWLSETLKILIKGYWPRPEVGQVTARHDMISRLMDRADVSEARSDRTVFQLVLDDLSAGSPDLLVVRVLYAVDLASKGDVWDDFVVAALGELVLSLGQGDVDVWKALTDDMVTRLDVQDLLTDHGEALLTILSPTYPDAAERIDHARRQLRPVVLELAAYVEPSPISAQVSVSVGTDGVDEAMVWGEPEPLVMERRPGPRSGSGPG